MRRHVFDTIVRRQLLVAAVIYALATIWMTWPLTPSAGSAIQDVGDPLFEIWVMRAVQHRLVNDPLSLYHANAFHPFQYSLAYSEEAISTALLAWPIYLISGNDVLAYNAMFLISFWLTGFAVFLLARELGASPGAAFVAGICAAFAPARFGHLSHLHMLVIGWLPLALWAFTIFVRGGQRRYLVIASAALAMLLLGSLHLAVFGSVALGLYALCLLAFERRERVWHRNDLLLLVIALAIPYLLLAPTLVPHLAAGAEYGFERPRAEIERYSAIPIKYVAVSTTNQFWPRWLPQAMEPFFPGAVAVIGAALAAAWLWLRSRPVWPAIFAITLTIIAVVASFGFAVQIAGRSVPLPYALLYDIAPQIRNIRGIGRIGLLTAIGIPMLAAFGYTTVWHILRARLRQHASAVGLALTVILSLAACLELRASVGTAAVPDGHTLAVYEWLADQPAGPVAEFPANGLLVSVSGPPGGLFQPIQYMYGSTRHWNPILAGYSGYIPAGHYDIISRFHIHSPDIQQSLPTSMNVGLLQDLGIRWVVIHRFDGYDWQAAIASADTLPELRRVAEVGDSVVYEMTSIGREPLPEVIGQLVLDDVAYRGFPYAGTIRFTNPHDNLALVQLSGESSLQARWLTAAGDVVREETLPVQLPFVLEPGRTEMRVTIPAPPDAGEFLLVAEMSTERITAAEHLVVVRDTSWWETPPVAFDGMAWEPQRPLRHGEALTIDVTWRAVTALDDNFAATVQLIDSDGNRVTGHDLLPGQDMPPTSAWRPGEPVTLSFAIWIDPAFSPGEYQLLAALYATQPGFPRVPLQLDDGSTATEVMRSGVNIAP